MIMKIKKSVIKPAITTTAFGVTFSTPKKFKYTKEETQFAMRSAMRLRSRAAKKWNCKTSEISLSLCLKEAYRRVAEEKLVTAGILSKVNKHKVKDLVKKEFGYNNIDTFVRKENVETFVPSNLYQNIILNIAKLEMKTRSMGY